MLIQLWTNPTFNEYYFPWNSSVLSFLTCVYWCHSSILHVLSCEPSFILVVQVMHVEGGAGMVGSAV